MMGFSERQVSALRRGLHPSHVRTRQAHGRELSYVEGWHVIAEANRIFGFDGWDRETIEPRCIQARENRGQFMALYTTKVRITVRGGGVVVVREGHGTGEGRAPSLGEAHDMALKVAETDATKRALATFGKPFGLALYMGGKRPREARLSAAGTKPAPLEPAPQAIPHHEASLPAIPGAGLQPGPAPAIESASDSIEDALYATRGRIDKSKLAIATPRRHRDKEHLRFVASEPCLLCGRKPADAHHLRFMQPRGLSLKSSDEYTVPLCRIHHRQLHQDGNEADWWIAMEIDPVPIARGLWEETLSRKRLTAR